MKRVIESEPWTSILVGTSKSMTNVAAQGVCFALTGENTDSIFLSF